MVETSQVVTSSVPVAIAVFKSANEIAPVSATPFTVQPVFAVVKLSVVASVMPA